METKHILKSKTVWFNVFLGLLGAIPLIGASELEKVGITGTLQNQILGALGVVGFIGNLYLRSITNTQITVKKTITWQTLKERK